MLPYDIEDRMVECESAHLGCVVTTRQGDMIEFRRGTFQNRNTRYVIGVCLSGRQQLLVPRADIVGFDLVT
ncbi:MAG: hypothetical protein COX82_04810 [Candidatus Magasanikbacteria bacterium CG_4_10_14_0_2_um_filter_41_10]|uniref:Uncharacterized protein n=1 Tax=Candidatus Magasanikbacteria bacterium CG_4_10_14_0_2_um_filter_41_10 TaxID=1974638 RepID=A0A2M7V1Y9_9BACT|nr:MAG: hypothetical protein COX82_04810 [Candidatus Magasanikbacteria bacterium CG_4_10_14_0_2_um_filter_41_10]